MTAREHLRKLGNAVAAATRVIRDFGTGNGIAGPMVALVVLMLGTTQLVQQRRYAAFFSVMTLALLCSAWVLYKEVRRFLREGSSEEGPDHKS